MKHAGSRQVGGYRSIPASSSAPKPKRPAKRPPTRHERRSQPPYSARFHARLTQLRAALRNDDRTAIRRLEHELDQLADAWEDNPTG